ncbi:hypothetical protein [Pseudomonas akapageensis]|uniref:hypothetical protein n=1 Tax=Pseudomonas akapageensis TaxID=2609961 RepID=UPI001407A411|nr:hypothetical protein [Pseudomonas akapageensis]
MTFVDAAQVVNASKKFGHASLANARSTLAQSPAIDLTDRRIPAQRQTCLERLQKIRGDSVADRILLLQ